MIERKGVRVWEWGGAETRTRSHTPARLHSLARARTSGLAAAMVLVAIILRIIPWLTNYPLHRDEALYGYWAQLIASGRDPLLLSPWVDKPPLVLYLLAADIRAFGASELALRLPGLIASLLLVLVTFGFARRAYGVRVALIAAGLLTLSPFAILFAPTAFTDPWLALWLVAAAWAALARRPFLAGLLLGLAVASKQQGVLGVPLVFALLIAAGEQKAQMSRRAKGRISAAPPLLRYSAPPLVLGFALDLRPGHLLGQPAVGQPAELLGSQRDDLRSVGPGAAGRVAAAGGGLGNADRVPVRAAGIERSDAVDRGRRGRAGHPGSVRAAAGSADGMSCRQQSPRRQR